MTKYLVYAMFYNCFVNELPVMKYIDVALEPIQFWSPTLWKHRAPFHIYQIHDSFLKRRRYIFIGEIYVPITKEVRDFLNRNRQLYIEDKNTYFLLYCFEGMYFLLPKFVTNQFFIS